MEQQEVVDEAQAREVWRRLAAEIAGDEVAEADVEGTLASIETLQQLVEHGTAALCELEVLHPGDLVRAPEGLVAVLRVEHDTVIVADHGVRPLNLSGPWMGVPRLQSS